MVSIKLTWNFSSFSTSQEPFASRCTKYTDTPLLPPRIVAENYLNLKVCFMYTSMWITMWINSFTRLLSRSLRWLAVKFAKESCFKKILMWKLHCDRDQRATGFPCREVGRIEAVSRKPITQDAPTQEFKATWKQCIDSVGQACKSLQKKT